METVLLILKALSDRNRLRIYSALTQHDELCACQMVELLQLAGATVSRHLGQMVHAGLIDSRKDGRFIYYKLSPDDRADVHIVRDWIHAQLVESQDIRNDVEDLERITSLDREVLCRNQRGEACCPVTNKS